MDLVDHVEKRFTRAKKVARKRLSLKPGKKRRGLEEEDPMERIQKRLRNLGKPKYERKLHGSG